MRPKLKVDPQLVERLARIGCTDAEIAEVLDISQTTLRRSFRAELNKGRGVLRRNIRRWQLRAARRGSVPMLIWLGKQYLGQRDYPMSAPLDVQVAEKLVFGGSRLGDSKNGSSTNSSST